MRGEVTTSAVQFLHRLKIVAELNRICILPCLQLDERLQFLGSEYSVTGAVNMREFVLPTRVDREVDVNNGFLGILLSYLCLGMGDSGFEVACFAVNGKKMLLRLN